MSESNRCPVCGSPPNAVDYFEFVDEHGKPTRIPGTWHCPNEMDDAHTGNAQPTRPGPFTDFNRDAFAAGFRQGLEEHGPEDFR